MKAQLPTQEKLWDLRKEHDYKQEFVAKAINVSTATISKYKNKDNKEFNLAILARLAKFYDVSLEWLAGTTEVREGSQTDVDELQIPFEQLSVDEHKTMKDVFKRSKLLIALPNRKKGK